MTDPTPEPDANVVLCQRCGKPMPPLPDDLAKLARSIGGVQLTHEVCPGETPDPPPGRYFEVRCEVVEVTEEQTGSTFGPDVTPDVTPDVHVEELLSFRCGTRAPNLSDAMRPLALALGEKWAAAERNAGIADA